MGRSLAVVLITFDNARYLPRCCEGIAGLRADALEVVVIDNASRDGSADLAEKHLPGARIIRNDVNRGYAAAANQGIAATRGEYVLFVNPDAFLAPDYAGRLVGALEAAGDRFSSATGKLLRGSGDAIEPTATVDSRGIRMTRSGRHFDIDADTPDTSGPAGPVPVFGVSGAAALHRRTFLEDVALEGEAFDEDFFAYREDADLAWRGQLRGWQALYVPDAVAWHVRRVTPERRGQLPAVINMHSVKNRFLLRLKNEGAWLALRNAPWELTRDLLVVGAAMTVERSSFPAIVWLWQHRTRVLRKRRLVQQGRRVSDRDLARWFN
jgi:GT2 family glycosyltransferase